MNNYVFILNENGNRITSLVDNELTEKEFINLAKKQFPDAAQFIYKKDGDAMLDEFIAGKIYSNGQMIDAPVIAPSLVELKEKEIADLTNDFNQSEVELLEAIRKALLLNDTELQVSIQADYADLIVSYKSELTRLKSELSDLKGGN